MQGIKSFFGNRPIKVAAALAALVTFGSLAGLGSPGVDAQAPGGPSLLPPPIHASAAQSAGVVVAPTREGPATLSRSDVETWLDGFMPVALARNDIAGATIAIVKDGQIVLIKGYGYADVAKRVPVDPNRHLFRPGSVSKLFTWTAVMQQVEQGKLDLDTDINHYLDFKIPPFEGKPITLRNIMTHTSGFEESFRGLIGPDPSNTKLEASLKRWVPHRVYAAGSTPAYSNYATGLAGYMVQRVSGEKFEDYIQHHIFQPLGMTHASFRQPLEPALLKDMAAGYLVGSGKPQAYEFVTVGPAGSLATTAPDMAKFMIAHLNNGSFNGAQILRPETARMMHGTPYTVLPPLHRMELGFYEHDINGHHVIAHAGDTRFFHSELNLFLDDHVGMFVSVNSSGHEGGAGMLRSALFEQFADRYFPGGEADGSVDPKVAADHAAAMAGHYDNSRRAHSSFAAITGFLGQTVVTTDGKGGLVVPSLKTYGGAVKKWHEIAPYVWRQDGGKDRLAAQVVDGRPVRFSFDDVSPFMVWDRSAWWRSTAWLTPMSYIALAALLLTVIAWPIAAGVRRHYRAPLTLAATDTRVYHGLRVAALLALLVPLGWMLVLQSMGAYVADGSSLTVKIILASLLTLVGFVGGFVLALWNGWLAWTKPGWASKLWSVVLILSFGVLLWIALVFKLLSFGTHF